VREPRRAALGIGRARGPGDWPSSPSDAVPAVSRPPLSPAAIARAATLAQREAAFTRLLDRIRPDAWFTLAQVGVMFGYTYERVRQLAHAGVFPVQVIGQVRMIRGLDVVRVGRMLGPSAFALSPPPQAVEPVMVGAADRLMDVDQVAARLGRTPQAVAQVLRAGVVTGGWPGHRHKLVDAEVLADPAFLAAIEGAAARPYAVKRRPAVTLAAPLRRSETRSYLGKPLAPLERRVMDLVLEGRSNGEIAGALHLSMDNVRGHRGRALQKLGLHPVTRAPRSFPPSL
jgi:DNA-binding CsgD family transcriptional regulator